MNEQFKNLVVKIESEEMLQQAREIIEGNGQKVCTDSFNLSTIKRLNYTYFHELDQDWGLSIMVYGDNEITLQEFEELFKINHQQKNLKMKNPITIKGYISLMKKVEQIDPSSLKGYIDLPEEIKNDIKELSGNISNVVYPWKSNKLIQ